MTVSGNESDVLFVDLDGTYVLDNSFHIFVRAMWRLGGITCKLAMLRAAATRIAVPAFGRVQMKRAILKLFSGSEESWQAGVVDSVNAQLTQCVSAPVARLIEEWRRAGSAIVLATAAPSAYAASLACSHGFDACLATAPDPDDPGWEENIGLAKAVSCEYWLRAQAVDRRVGVITDHIDDLPLMGLADVVFVQSSRASFHCILAGLLPRPPDVYHLDTEACDEDGGVWLWIDDRPRGPLDDWEVRTILSKHRYALVFKGNAGWMRLRSIDTLDGAVRRRDAPTYPSALSRTRIRLRRWLIRDRLGVFH